MRNPIRTKEARAARSIHYSLIDPCALHRRFSRAASENARNLSIPVLALILILALATPLLGCSDTARDAEARDLETTTDPGATTAPSNSKNSASSTAPVIVFLGTSLTAGYGLEEDQAFPALIQERIETRGLDYRVINAGVSGDTSAGGLRRLDWLLRLPVSMLVLELGANDMLRGQSPENLRLNLEAILDKTRETHPGVRFVIAGMRAAPNLGARYVDAFDAIYPALAERYSAALVPFLLEDVAARRDLNQADGIHPTAEGHALIAERVWQTLSPLLAVEP